MDAVAEVFLSILVDMLGRLVGQLPHLVVEELYLLLVRLDHLVILRGEVHVEGVGHFLPELSEFTERAVRGYGLGILVDEAGEVGERQDQFQLFLVLPHELQVLTA